MSVGRNSLMRTLGHPRGLLGRLGGIIMARANYRHAGWVIDLLDVREPDMVLEVGFGPGVAIRLLAGSAHHVAGVDPSADMLRLASRHNADSTGNGRVDPRQGSAARLQPA